MRTSFVMYTGWREAFDNQPDEIAGQLIKAIFEYVETNQIPTIDNQTVKGMFFAFRPIIDNNNQRYDKAVEQRREAGRRSAELRQRSSTVVNERQHPSTVVNYNDNDNVNVNENDNVHSKECVCNKEHSHTSDEAYKFYEGMEKSYPRVCSLPKPLTFKQYIDIVNKYGVDLVREKLQNMENHVPLTSKYIDAAATLRSWCKTNKK